MISEILLNILICCAITVSSFTLAGVLTKSRLKKNNKPALISLVSLWSLIGLTYMTISASMVATYLQNPHLHTAMINLGLIFFSFVSVPLVFFIIYVIIGNKKISTFISSIFAMFSIIYLSYLHSSNIEIITSANYGSFINMISDISIYTYVIALFVIPTSMILGLLLLLFLQKLPRETHYRKTLPIVGISLVFDFMLLDLLTQISTIQLSARIFVIVGIVLTFLAYFPPDLCQDKLKIKEYF